MATSTGMGLTALSWQELRAFRQENKLNLTLWERATLKKMSEAYAYEYCKASDPSRQPPYKQERTVFNEEEHNIKKAMKMMDVLSAMKNRGKQ
jgi:hypothetical protein